MLGEQSLDPIGVALRIDDQGMHPVVGDLATIPQAGVSRVMTWGALVAVMLRLSG